MKDELNRSYIGGEVVYLLQSELSTLTLQYIQINAHIIIILDNNERSAQRIVTLLNCSE